MNTTIFKDKPDLLFNNPLKQKVYVFLKNHPGRDFETFQVLSGEPGVSRQHFNEVEQAIKAREDREKNRLGSEKVNELFLMGGPFAKPRTTTTENPREKESMLKKFEKKKLNERAKQYIKENPGCMYEELVKSLDFKELTKPHFFSMKTQLRKKGLIPEESRTRRGRKMGDKKSASAPRDTHVVSSFPTKTIEILESIDATDLTDQMREHYKSHILPLIQRLMPHGEKLQMVFLTDPPTIELRRGVVR